MSNAGAPARDALDDKVNRLFAGKVVRKDLVRKVKVGANVPVFVLEFLLGKYCASSDEMAIQMGLQVVNETLANNYIRPDESVKAQSKFTADEWIDLIVRSMGYEPAGMSRRLKLLFLLRLVPLTERNYNLIELGPRGTGKTYVVQEISPY